MSTSHYTYDFFILPRQTRVGHNSLESETKVVEAEIETKGS